MRQADIVGKFCFLVIWFLFATGGGGWKEEDFKGRTLQITPNCNPGFERSKTKQQLAITADMQADFSRSAPSIPGSGFVSCGVVIAAKQILQ